MAVKSLPVGAIQTKKDRTGQTVRLGNPNAKNEKYRYTVQIRVLDSSGNVIGKTENPYIQIKDPRKNTSPNFDVNKVPDYIVSELLLTFDDGT